MNKKPRGISLFSGVLGLDLGLEQSGIMTAVALEKNPVAVRTILQNKGPRFPLIDRPVEQVTTSELLQRAKLKSKEAFVVTGGPCCQSFSTAGKRRSISDGNKGQLFRHFTRIVAQAKPRFFIMENVKGMLSAAIRHRPLDQRGPGFPPLAPDEELGSALRVIREELAALEYYVIFGLLNCADYGVPQKRYRVIFIGSRDGEPISLPLPTHSETGDNGLKNWVSLREALDDIYDPKPEFITFNKERRELLKLLGPGENWTDLPKRLHRIALGAAADTWGGRSGFCRRLSWEEPSPTLTTDPTGRATTLCHPRKLRPLSVREYARLQQFPSDWDFAGSTFQKYEQIGNAVPVGLGEAIGNMLIEVAGKVDQSKGKLRNKTLLGKVVCADSNLEERLQKRRKTQLHPPWKRKNANPEAARAWLELVAA